MTRARILWLTWSLLWCWLGLASFARAEVRVSTRPAGWDDAGREASERAQAWASELGGRVEQAYATRTNDGFYETLAIIEIPGALDGTALVDPEEALETAAGALFDVSPMDTRILDPLADAPVMMGRYEGPTVTHDVAVVSAGSRRALVILAVRTEEQSLYAEVFEDVLLDLRGAAAPIVPFDHARWRWIVLVSGVVLGLAIWIVLSRTSLGNDGTRDVGRVVGITSMLLGLLASGIAYLALADLESELAVAGLDRALLAAEVALMGMLVGAVAFAFGIVRDGSVRRIESAPTGGTFGTATPSGQTLSSNLVPSSSPAALTSPGYGLSVEDMERGDREAMRTPVPTLRGTAAVGEVQAEPAFDDAWADADDDADDDEEDTNEAATRETIVEDDAPVAKPEDDSAQDTAPVTPPVPPGADTTVGPPPPPPTSPDPTRGNTQVAAVVPPPRRGLLRKGPPSS